MTTRIPSIESFRVLAIVMVILWHTDFVTNLIRSAGGRLPVVVTASLIWWAGVPYFLITAGYFFRQSVQNHGNHLDQYRRYVTPLTWMLTAWLCVYSFVPRNWPGEVVHHGLWQPFYLEALRNVLQLKTHTLQSFLEGQRPVAHLWFVPALLFSLAILTLMEIYRLQKYVIPLIIGLYAFVLAEEAAGGYLFRSTVHLELWSIALLLTAIGWWLVGHQRPSAALACSVIVAGYTFALIEGEIMQTLLHSSRRTILDHNYLGGILIGLGIFLLALAKPRLGRTTPFPSLATLTLGIYLSHFFVIYTLDPVRSRLRGAFPVWGDGCFTLLIYGISALLTLALMKVPIARYLVVRPAKKHQRIAPSSKDERPAVTKLGANPD
ncbi:MAG: hypothetical protein H8K04_06595 [Nitrospira sp.]